MIKHSESEGKADKTADKEKFMQIAVDLSRYALDSGTGGPFGAVIVKDGKIVGVGSNKVLAEQDPTAHAEIVAIKDACRNLDTIDLSGCDLYSSAEPCPLCTAAIYWANLNRTYYSNTADDAMHFGFEDKKIHEELKKPKTERQKQFERIKNDEALSIFEIAGKQKDS